MTHSLATVINYCSNEFRFLEHCVKEARKFSKQILITVCDHFFDGTKEQIDQLQKTFLDYPDCTFLYYPFFLSKVPKRVLQRIGDNFCCTFSRLLGWSYLEKDIEYVLFLDADEVVESNKFLDWLDHFNYRNFEAIKLANYWYFREARFRAMTWEDSVVLAKKEALSRSSLLQEGDRIAAFRNARPKISMATGMDGKPFIHHFSWVRTKEEMIKKVSTWGHKKERNWVVLVEEEFSRGFNGKDFVHGYAFEEVRPYADIDMKIRPKKSMEKHLANVHFVLDQTINKILGKGFYRFFPLYPPMRKELD